MSPHLSSADTAVQRVGRDCHLLSASMSPHPFECGYPRIACATACSGELQCHRTLSSADTDDTGLAAVWSTVASMSPHPFECGYQDQVDAVRISVASMSPHPFECGYAGRFRSERCRRGFNVTAPFRVRIPAGVKSAADEASSLQCHRTLSSADTVLMSAMLVVRRSSLQCHRTLSSADTSAVRRVLVGGAVASMSPHPFECGYGLNQNRLFGTWPRFNVTAPFRVRIPGHEPTHGVS